MAKIRNIIDVSNWRLCVGCGACAYICPDKIKLRNVINQGIRPSLESNQCGLCDECVRVCPGYETIDNYQKDRSGLIKSLIKGYGPIIEVWEGYAAEPDIRYHGSSGGLASALALYCLKKKGMHGALHVAASKNEPWKNETVLSLNLSDLLERTGSRYGPASPCESLMKIESAPEPCVFIGKPCDVNGLRKAQFLRPALSKKIGVAIGIFCAGTPSTQGTIDLLKYHKINLDDIDEIRYRGNGWPGTFNVIMKNKMLPPLNLSYNESWGFLNTYRPFRCYLCPDGTGEFADISCGDPWYREVKEDELGYSLLLVRTEKGREILHGAIKAGYVVLEKSDPKILITSQKNLLLKRGAIWGRLMTMKALGIPTPRLHGFSLFSNWCGLSALDKIRSVLGTARRIITRKYYKPING